MLENSFSIRIRHDITALACIRVTITNPKTGVSADFNGAIDTGCTFIAISEKVVEQLHFTSRYSMQVSSASDTDDRDVYHVALTVPNSENGINFPDLLAVDFKATPSIDVLIGMNALRQGDLYMREDKSGDTVLTFHVPHNTDEPCKGHE